MFKTIIIGIIVTIISLFALNAVDRITNADIISSNSTYTIVETEDSSSSSSKEKVSVSGEVNHTGTYSISSDYTLGDLLSLCGGVTDSADSSCYNESVLIGSHKSFYIAPVLVNSSGCVDTSVSKANINEPELSELKEVGFTTTQANALITYYEENGDFEVLEDIENVKGIGSGTFDKVKDYICLA